MIDPLERAVTLDRPAGRQVGRYTTGRIVSELCPGFWLDADWLWQTPLPRTQVCLEAILNRGSQ
jgi:hypothetical protein